MAAYGADGSLEALISPDEFARALEDLGAPKRLVIACSGGPDSTALLRLAATARNAADLLAVTVDHGLRPESGQEAAQVRVFSSAIGVVHETLTWDGPKPASGVQEAARRARYRLFAALAEQRGFEAVLVGHNADDQAETVLMRLARGAGVRGLGGVGEQFRVAAGPGRPVAILRPLLRFPRARILATLDALGQEFLNDPSNEKLDFERVRMRGLLAALEEQSILTRAALQRSAARLRRAAARLDDADREAFDRAGGSFHAHGYVRLKDPLAAPASLIARLLRAVGAGDFAPREDDAAKCLGAALQTGAGTLGGAALKREGDGLYFYREPAALLGREGVAPFSAINLPPGGKVLFDGRFIVENPGVSAVTIRPFGALGVESLKAAARLERCPAFALAATPAAGGDLKPASARNDLLVESLLEERFNANVMRIP